MEVDRVQEWKQFADHMEGYIRDRTIEKYKMDDPGGLDLMTLAKPEICIWSILKYAMRCWNGKSKPHDIEKIAHYACFAWTMNGKDS